jgi:outer membrane biosynthesis protein TonB
MSSRQILFVSLLCVFLVLPAVAQNREPSKRALMAYTKKIMSAIGPLWYRAVDRNRDYLSPGTARPTFRITPEGRVENLRLVSNTSNQFLAEASAQSIRQAKLPAIPKTVLKEAGQNWIDFSLPFTIFPK